MKENVILSILLILFIGITCCRNESSDLFLEQSDMQNIENMRKIFRNTEELEVYFNKVKDDERQGVTTRSSTLAESKSLVDKFLEYTSMNKIHHKLAHFMVFGLERKMILAHMTKKHLMRNSVLIQGNTNIIYVREQ
ncbi:MAG: hypothetical protein LBP50_04345 [Tannerella sp.]|jgi:hypothetical protein|nr:hypothetical protein [Tannerella sp.]